MPFNPAFSPFIRRFAETIVLLVLFMAVFVIYVRSEKEIDKQNEIRIQSMKLAKVLRQSSDDLTRMVRTYVVSGEKRYKQHYQEILDIRNGLSAAPYHYDNIYWDLVLNDDKRPSSKSNIRTPLIEVMRQAGFSEEEFKLLAMAKANSDALTATEFRAIALREHRPYSHNLHDQAIRMLYDEKYHKAKAAIMQPIRKVELSVEERTGNAVALATQHAMYYRLLFIFIGFVLFINVWRLYRSITRMLGASADEIEFAITKIGSLGAVDFPHAEKIPENSVMGWILKTRHQLKTTLESNRRLNRLYQTQSQISQAIIVANDRHTLFEVLCREIVLHGGMKMAWIGLIDHDNRSIIPINAYGSGIEYLDNIVISIDPSDSSSQGASGQAYLKARSIWIDDFQHDPRTALWHERAKQFGWGSSGALPLFLNGEVIAVYAIYSAHPFAFDSASKKLLEDMTGEVNYALEAMEQKSKRHEAEATLIQTNTLMNSIINTAPVRIFWKDLDLRYMGCNQLFAQDAGLNDPSELIGKTDYEMTWKEEAELYRADDRRVIETLESKLFYEEPQTTPTGEQIWLSTSKVPLHDKFGNVIGILGLYEDITERKSAEQQIRYLANYDPLTGLPNRLQLDNTLQDMLSIARRSGTHLSVMFLDIDRFKEINDTLGHSVGDKILIESANRIQKILREEDMVARLGGDEFVFLLPNTSMQGATMVADKILKTFESTYYIATHELNVSASIGIAIYPNDGQDFGELYKNADTAMYRAKKLGRNNFCFFTEEMQLKSIRNLELTNALRHALERNELSLVYQPQVLAEDHSLSGVETLLRWNHPTLGMISPAEFIPLAEESAQILPIGEWVIRNAVGQAKKWYDEGYPLITAVNLSAVQFRSPTLLTMIRSVLDDSGLPPEYLELELTESAAMHDPDQAIAIMSELHKHGIRMSIDDFGTGYSSLSYLKKFKVYKLKIDQSFVRDINVDPEDKAIVKAIISMSKSLGLQTIAEGVETIGQMDFLHHEGCDEFQGYYFSRPLGIEEFEAYKRKLQPQ